MVRALETEKNDRIPEHFFSNSWLFSLYLLICSDALLFSRKKNYCSQAEILEI
jgi:hypothetical protein